MITAKFVDIGAVSDISLQLRAESSRNEGVLIYVDVSQVCRYLEKGRNATGIQRVTLESINGLHKAYGDKLRLVKFDDGNNGISQAPVALLDEIRTAKGNAKLARLPQTVGENRWQSLTGDAIAGHTVFLSENLRGITLYDALAKLRQRCAFRVVQVIYDVIPLVSPEYRNTAVEAGFRRVIGPALQMADEVVAISSFTRDDLKRVCSDLLRPEMPIHVWPLAHEFRTAKADAKTVPHKVIDPFVVMAGTIEDRKNQHLVVAAWRKLLRKHGWKMPQLVLVGKLGYFTRPLASIVSALIVEHLWRKKIVALSKCDDKTLRALYDRCQFSIFVSSYEGWGLPIGESLWCGSPVLSGNSTSLPEVGGDLVDYVDPHDEAALLAQIEKLCFDEGYRETRSRKIAQAKLRSWSDVTRELRELLETG